MNTDQMLSEKLTEYNELRRRIWRGITSDLPGIPQMGGKDVIRWIGALERPNVTSIAEKMGVTRGGASRAVAKLLAAGIVSSYQLPENRKEVYYRLTEKGQDALSELERARMQLREREMAYFDEIPEEDKRAVIRFMTTFVGKLQGALPDRTEEKENT